MDDPATAYIKTLLDFGNRRHFISFVFLAYRSRKEQSFIGFKSRSFDEKYAGYALLAIGIVIIIVSIYELLMLLNCDIFYNSPLVLSDVSIAGQVVSGQVLGLFFAIDFWLTIFGLGGGKFVSLGLDMLQGKKVTLRRNIQA